MKGPCQVFSASAAGQWWKLGGMLNFPSVWTQMLSHHPSRAGWAGVCPSCAKHLIFIWRCETELKGWMNQVFFFVTQIITADRLSVLVWHIQLVCWRDLWPGEAGWVKCAPQVEEKPQACLPQTVFITDTTGVGFPSAFSVPAAQQFETKNFTTL